MNHRTGLDRSQTFLFPERLEDYVTPDNPVRFLDAFVGSLDLHALGFARARCADTGRPPYAPALLLKLYLYGYLHRIRSSRRLEAECHRNVELIWLTGKLAPDFKTIADFRKDKQARPAPTALRAKRIGVKAQPCSAANSWPSTGASSAQSTPAIKTSARASFRNSLTTPTPAWRSISKPSIKPMRPSPIPRHRLRPAGLPNLFDSAPSCIRTVAAASTPVWLSSPHSVSSTPRL